MARMSDDYYRDEIRQGRKLMYHPCPEIRRRNKIRVKYALAELKRRRRAR